MTSPIPATLRQQQGANQPRFPDLTPLVPKELLTQEELRPSPRPLEPYLENTVMFRITPPVEGLYRDGVYSEWKENNGQPVFKLHRSQYSRPYGTDSEFERKQSWKISGYVIPGREARIALPKGCLIELHSLPRAFAGSSDEHGTCRLYYEGSESEPQKYALDFGKLNKPEKESSPHDFEKARMYSAKEAEKLSQDARNLISALSSPNNNHLTNQEKAERICAFVKSECVYELSHVLADKYDAAKSGAELLLLIDKTRRGDCETINTFFVSLLREAGIPSRIIAGYKAPAPAKGETETILRLKDSHAWSEVWDEKKGWLELDATPSR